jgi:hypothetical protein
MSRKNPPTQQQQHHENNGASTTVSAETVSGNGQDGRDEQGRFTKGNKGGPGNPFAGSVAKLRKAALAVISEDDMQSVFRVLLLRAQGGHLPAMKLLFAYTIGLPVKTVDPDEVLELEEEIAEAVPKPEPREPSEPGSVAREFIDGLQGTLHAAGIDETLRQHLDGKLRSFFHVEHEQHADGACCAPLLDNTDQPKPMHAQAASAEQDHQDSVTARPEPRTPHQEGEQPGPPEPRREAAKPNETSGRTTSQDSASRGPVNRRQEGANQQGAVNKRRFAVDSKANDRQQGARPPAHRGERHRGADNQRPRGEG